MFRNCAISAHRPAGYSSVTRRCPGYVDDFFTVEVCSLRGLVSHNVPFLIELARRVVHIAAITRQPNEVWMLQIASQVH